MYLGVLISKGALLRHVTSCCSRREEKKGDFYAKIHSQFCISSTAVDCKSFVSPVGPVVDQPLESGPTKAGVQSLSLTVILVGVIIVVGLHARESLSC